MIIDSSRNLTLARNLFSNNQGRNPKGKGDLQFINNVFDGASDDCLDLDSTDAWIEGNIFMHVHRDPARTLNSQLTGALRSAIDATVGCCTVSVAVAVCPL